jgi:hypothetical protein
VNIHSKNTARSGSGFFVSPRAAIIGLAFAAISTASFAAGTAEQRQACTGDVFRLCSSDIPNVDRIVACLKRQRTSLSSACQAVIASTETASATRSVTPPDNSDYCTFSSEHTSPEHRQWREWCGTAAR